MKKQTTKKSTQPAKKLPSKKCSGSSMAKKIWSPNPNIIKP